MFPETTVHGKPAVMSWRGSCPGANAGWCSWVCHSAWRVVLESSKSICGVTLYAIRLWQGLQRGTLRISSFFSPPVPSASLASIHRLCLYFLFAVELSSFDLVVSQQPLPIGGTFRWQLVPETDFPQTAALHSTHAHPLYRSGFPSSAPALQSICHQGAFGLFVYVPCVLFPRSAVFCPSSCRGSRVDYVRAEQARVTRAARPSLFRVRGRQVMPCRFSLALSSDQNHSCIEIHPASFREHAEASVPRSLDTPRICGHRPYEETKKFGSGQASSVEASGSAEPFSTFTKVIEHAGTPAGAAGFRYSFLFACHSVPIIFRSPLVCVPPSVPQYTAEEYDVSVEQTEDQIQRATHTHLQLSGAPRAPDARFYHPGRSLSPLLRNRSTARFPASGSESGGDNSIADALARLIQRHAREDAEFARVADSVTLSSGRNARKGCPEFTSSWSRCSASCGHGYRYRFTQRIRPRDSACTTRVSSQSCAAVSGCSTPWQKWDAIGVKKPEEMPEAIFLELGEKIPPESEWQIDTLPDGAIYFLFKTGLSQRHFKRRILSDTECGLALRSYFQISRQEKPDSAAPVFVTEFVSTGAYIPCPGDEEGVRTKGGPLPHLAQGRPVPPAPKPRTSGLTPVTRSKPQKRVVLSPEDERRFNEMRKFVLDLSSEFPALEAQLQPAVFERTDTPQCPIIESTQTSCTSTCGRGDSLFFRVRPGGARVCRVEPVVSRCEAISGCPDVASKWRALRVTRPDQVPQEIFEELGAQLPDETEWEDGRGVCSIFGTGHTRRFRREGGEILESEAPGAAVRAFFVREVREVAPGNLRCVAFLGFTDADIIPPIDESAVDSVLLEKHNEFRQKYGVGLLSIDPILKKFAEYWAWQLEERGCIIQHSDRDTRVAYMGGAEFRSTGENLSLSCTLGSSSWRTVPAGWFEEVFCYKYGKTGNPCIAQPLPKCNPESHAEGIMVGHFTQLMSDRSSLAACAVRYCRQPCNLGDKVGQKVLTVCNYAEAGNVEGTYPFSRAVAEKLVAVHPDIFEAGEDDESQRFCRLQREIWAKKNPLKQL
ncbi:SCP family extracellular subfamily protein [Besnoitia besnoiti]|uniref:SCP family extracellular subfamily protein n=1 Tax=Besnoitia besnoiti TaxID=94643 RepID=A0A2A9M9T4_BESBE|nr:SCP family extracellular subfamily protein [Besnoitia besnoiti]PFH35238.1 SCP family extracellular subfamily protein [Besnoitia besnoiti]